MKKVTFVTTFVLISLSGVFSQIPAYEVYALRYAEIEKPMPLAYLAVDAPKEKTIEGVFLIWLIKGNNGKNVLVDAGFLKDIEEAEHFGIKNYLRPDSALLRVGVKASEITDIILTHPHWDHMDGMDLFPNATVWIQKEDFQYTVGGAWQKDGNKGFNKRDVRKLVECNMAGKLNLVDGDDKEILPGIKVYTGSRHTFNSQYVLVTGGKDKIILASDNAYTYFNLENLKSAPEGATFDPAGYVNAMKRMKTLVSNPNFIIPGHDGLLFSKFPKVAEGVIKIN